VSDDTRDTSASASNYTNLNLPLVRYNSTFTFTSGGGILYISPVGELVRYVRRERFAGPDEVELYIIDTDVRSIAGRLGGFNIPPARIFWLRNDDTLWAQGSNSAGALGDNTGVDRNEPVQILDNVATFHYNGNGSVFAIRNDQSLWAWGWGERYQLGTGDAENRYSPTRIMDNVVRVYTQNIYTFALLSDGSLYAWGTYSTSVYDTHPRRIFNGVKNVFPLAGSNLDNEFLASGDYAFITGDNKVYTWSMPRTMQQINNPDPPVSYMPDWDITYIRIMWQGDSASRSSNVNQFFITTDGTLWGMGDNAIGELTDGTRIRRNEPVEILNDVAAVIPIRRVFEPSTPIVILNDGSLWHWIYDGYFTPQRALDNVRNYTNGFYITTGGSVFSSNMNRVLDETVAIPNYLIKNLFE